MVSAAATEASHAWICLVRLHFARLTWIEIKLPCKLHVSYRPPRVSDFEKTRVLVRHAPGSIAAGKRMFEPGCKRIKAHRRSWGGAGPAGDTGVDAEGGTQIRVDRE